MNILRFLVLQINGLFPFLYPLMHLFKNFNFFKGIASYFREYSLYKKMDAKVKSQFPIKLQNLYPIYFDRYDTAGEIPKHYFHMDLWAAKKIFKTKVKVHYDVGSRLDSFISHCLVFCKVVMIDVRPLKVKVPNLEFIQADGMNMKNIKSNSLNSISALHAIEHFGLGRYGDPIDPNGHKKAIKELVRVSQKNGNIFFAGPIGIQRIEFNAHRVFNPNYIIELFAGCELKEFSAINDKNEYIENAKPDDFTNAQYSCGLFHFVKK